MKKSAIVDLEKVLATLTQSLDGAERMAGCQVNQAWLSIGGTHIKSQNSKGVVAVAHPNQEITSEDVERVIEAAKAIATPPNYEILHVIPKNFTVDSQTGIKDPIGMSGIRLEVETQIVQGLTSQIKNLTKCIYRTGIDIDDLVLSILATAESVLTNRQKELGVVVVNLGGATSGLAVFEENDLLQTTVLPIGSEYVTNDIALGLKISIDTAEKIKIREGSCLPKEVKKNDLVKYAELGAPEDGDFSRKEVAEIIEARIEEIMENVDKELKKIGKSGMLPAGVVLTGGGAKLDGLAEVAKNVLRLPASLGYPRELISNIGKVSDLSFTTAIGLVLWGSQLQERGRHGLMPFQIGGSIEGATKHLRKWFKNILP